MALSTVDSWFQCSFCHLGKFSGHDIYISHMFDALKSGAMAGCWRCEIWLAGMNVLIPSKEQDADDRLCFSEPGLPTIIYEPPLGGEVTITIANGRQLTSHKGWERRLFMEIFTTSKKLTDFGILPPLTIPPGDTESSTTFETLRSWINVCDSFHPQCRIFNPPLPTRILEIQQNGESFTMKLHVSTDDCGPYVCLSHCWGNVRPSCLTTRQSLQQNMQAIPWELLPKTFQHAAIITHRLGLKYLWIDSMCIIQDDMNDWDKESGKMADIYQRSYLTIAATSAPDDSGGLFFCEDIEYTSHEIRSPTTELCGGEVFVRKYRGHMEPTKANPLLKRAWVFQEMALSPRVVHFTENELLWQCRTAQACECGSRWQDTAHYSNKVRPWYRTVEDYSKLDLTFEDDKLPALSGAAKASEEWKLGQRYLAGLWYETFMQDLLWQPAIESRRPKKWRAPTWSWASVDGGVVYRDIQPLAQYTTLQSVDCETGLDPTGQVKSGLLLLNGPMVKVTLTAGRYDFRQLDELPGDRYLGFRADYDLNEETEHQVLPGNTLYCLRIVTVEDPAYGPCDFCLILRRFEHTFRRVGIIHDRRMNQKGEIESLFSDAKAEDVSII